MRAGRWSSTHPLFLLVGALALGEACASGDQVEGSLRPPTGTGSGTSSGATTGANGSSGSPGGGGSGGYSAPGSSGGVNPSSPLPADDAGSDDDTGTDASAPAPAPSGSSGTGSSSGSPPSSSGTASDSPGTMPTHLPTVSGTCPTYSAGSGNTVTFTASPGTIQAQVWAGSPIGGGPLILYWNGTSSSPGAEIPIAFDVSAVEAAGGLIVGFVSGSRTGTTGADTGGDLYWYSTDVDYADQAVACAIEQYHIDTRHIHVAGYSAGALQTVYMWGARSSYVASVISYSGGYITLNAPQSSDAPYENAANVAPAIAAHGAMGQDDLIVDFAQASATWESMISMAHGTYIDCNDGGNHLAFFSTRAPNLEPVAWKFFDDHPYGVSPEPYTSLPSGFPSYCALNAAGTAP